MNIQRTGRNFAVAALIALGVSACISSPADAAVFNVKKFGAVGNGTTDDTTAILSAISAAQAASGNSVLFPAGNYLYTSDLKFDGITLTGEEVSRINKHKIPTATLTSEERASLVALGSNSKVKFLGFATHSIDIAEAIKIHRADKFQVQHCSFANGFSSCVEITDSEGGSVTDCAMFVPNKNASAIFIIGDKNFGTTNQNISIDRNKITGTGNGSIGIHLADVSSTPVTIQANQISNLDLGVYALRSSYTGRSTIEVVNNTVTNCRTYIRGVFSKLLVANNRIAGPITPRRDGSGVNIDNSVGSVTNNNISGVDRGIVVFESNRVTIKANVISRFLRGGVNVQNSYPDVANSTHIEVSECQITNGKDGIFGINVLDCIFKNNNIRNVTNRGIGIFGTSNDGVKIKDNRLENCGLLPFSDLDPAAVIFASGSAASPNITITDNFYTGKTTNLSFFIRCLVSAPPAKVNGNKTSTTLPTVVGP